jgi:hypothetical protein
MALELTDLSRYIGPKTNSVEALSNLRKAGMNVGTLNKAENLPLLHPSHLMEPLVRMNFSHGSYEYHQSVIDNVRKMVAGAIDCTLTFACHRSIDGLSLPQRSRAWPASNRYRARYG